MKVFLSYAREDSGAAGEVYSFLKDMGLSPWQDTRNLLAGEDWLQEIERNIRLSDVFCIFLSKSIEKDSPILAREMSIAKETELTQGSPGFIFPILLDSESSFRAENYRQWIDFRSNNWRFALFQALVGFLRRRGQSGPTADIQEGSLVVKNRYSEKLRGIEDCIVAQFPHFYVPTSTWSASDIHTLIHGDIWRQMSAFRAQFHDDEYSGFAQSESRASLEVDCDPYVLGEAFLSAHIRYYSYLGGRPYPNLTSACVVLYVEELSLVNCYRLFGDRHCAPLPMELIELIARSVYPDGHPEEHLPVSEIVDYVQAGHDHAVFDSFVLTRSGITFHFSRGDIGGGAVGAPTVCIHPSAILPHLLDTPLTRALRDCWECTIR